ncbi:MAG: MBL fold metallo-hydrolase [Clostridiales bacterium]|nr:MBL fold metallo-hydrolase [Clostridiales bacterium]
MTLSYCSLASGSAGNCHFISTETTHIILDFGMSTRYVKNSLEAIGFDIADVQGVFITHEHSDHIKGLKTFIKNYNIPVYMNKCTFDFVKEKVREEDWDKVIIVEGNIDMIIGDISIVNFDISHDAAHPTGYNFFHMDKKLSIVTDIGIMTDEVVSFLEQSNFLVIEANHDVNMLMFGPYPYYLKRRINSEIGHLSNEEAAKTVFKVYKTGKLKNVVLAHLSRENNMPELAHLTVQKYLEENGVDTDVDINLDLTYRDKTGKFYRIV